MNHFFIFIYNIYYIIYYNILKYFITYKLSLTYNKYIILIYYYIFSKIFIPEIFEKFRGTKISWGNLNKITMIIITIIYEPALKHMMYLFSMQHNQRIE